VITDLSRLSGADLGVSTREDLLAELQPLVVRTVRLVVGSGSAVAEDPAQEALLEMTRSLPHLKNVAAAPARAMRIATRVALRTAKREARLSPIGVRALRAPETMAGDASVEMLELKEAFDQLPPKLRATAVLRLHIGFSEAETAAALG
jgi:DNA-directed RNA polymerase specialized sigma24 family protein